MELRNQIQESLRQRRKCEENTERQITMVIVIIRILKYRDRECFDYKNTI